MGQVSVGSINLSFFLFFLFLAKAFTAILLEGFIFSIRTCENLDWQGTILILPLTGWVSTALIQKHLLDYNARQELCKPFIYLFFICIYILKSRPCLIEFGHTLAIVLEN
jgi:hypothetical protein